MTSLSATDVVWSASGVPVLAGVSLEARSREVLGVLGPNGAGKTSLLRILAGLRRPDGGAVRLDGVDLVGMRRRSIARRLAIVEQSPEVHEDITVREVAELGRTPHRRRFAHLDAQDRDAVDHALAVTGLSSYATRSWRSLSGGEQQRAQLARALAQRPEVIVLDEPTNHLDIRYQLDVLRLLSSLDVTVVTALHDLALAARFCDTVAVLSDGGIRAIGSPESVLTADLLRSVYGVEAVVERSAHTGTVIPTYLTSVPDHRPAIANAWS